MKALNCWRLHTCGAACIFNTSATIDTSLCIPADETDLAQMKRRAVFALFLNGYISISMSRAAHKLLQCYRMSVSNIVRCNSIEAANKPICFVSRILFCRSLEVISRKNRLLFLDFDLYLLVFALLFGCLLINFNSNKQLRHLWVEHILQVLNS